MHCILDTYQIRCLEGSYIRILSRMVLGQGTKGVLRHVGPGRAATWGGGGGGSWPGGVPQGKTWALLYFYFHPVVCPCLVPAGLSLYVLCRGDDTQPHSGQPLHYGRTILGELSA